MKKRFFCDYFLANFKFKTGVKACSFRVVSSFWYRWKAIFILFLKAFVYAPLNEVVTSYGLETGDRYFGFFGTTFVVFHAKRVKGSFEFFLPLKTGLNDLRKSFSVILDSLKSFPKFLKFLLNKKWCKYSVYFFPFNL